MGAASLNNALHVVLLPFPEQGHFSPVIHLAKKIAAQGFIVTIVNVNSIHKKLLNKWSCPHGLDIRLEQVHFPLNIPDGLDSLTLENREYVRDALEAMEAFTEELLKFVQPRPCCVVADYFLPWAIRVCNRLNLRPVTYWPGNAAWASMHHHLDLLVSNGDAFQDLPAGDKRDKLISYIPGVTPLSHEDLPHYFKMQKSGALLKYFKEDSDRMKNCEWVLVNSMEELEPYTFQMMRTVCCKNFAAVGPLFPLVLDGKQLGVSLREENDKCLNWLDTQAEKSVLYISFGSITTLSKSTYEELAAGLEASQQPFLWVTRPDLLKDNTTNEVVEQFKERTRQQGLVVTWAPQIQVVAHSAVGGFLSHCGWNSTFESICYGVPLLGYPGHSEQRMNNKMIEEDWGFGKRLSAGSDLDRTEVERNIRDFMQGPDTELIRSKLKEFKDMANRTATHGGRSHANLQAFMQEMRS